MRAQPSNSVRYKGWNLQPDTQRQAVLFDTGPDRARSARAMIVSDAIDGRYGRDAVHMG